MGSRENPILKNWSISIFRSRTAYDRRKFLFPPDALTIKRHTMSFVLAGELCDRINLFLLPGFGDVSTHLPVSGSEKFICHQ